MVEIVDSLSYDQQLDVVKRNFVDSPLATIVRTLAVAPHFQPQFEGSKRDTRYVGEFDLGYGPTPIAIKRWKKRRVAKEIALFEAFFLSVAAEKGVDVPAFTFGVEVDNTYVLVTEDLTSQGKYALHEIRNMSKWSHLKDETRITDAIELDSWVTQQVMGAAQVYGNIGLSLEFSFRLLTLAAENGYGPMGSCLYAVVDEKRSAVNRIVCGDVDQLFELEKFNPRNGYLDRVNRHPELLDDLLVRM